MLKKVLYGTMAMGLAAIIGLPELSLASAQQSRPTLVKHAQVELVAKHRKRGKRMRKRMRRHTQFQQPQVQQQQYHV